MNNDFLKHLEVYLSKEDIKKLNDSFNNNEVKGFYLNTNFENLDIVFSQFKTLSANNLIKNAYFYDNNEELGKSILFDLGYFYIQEPSSTIVPNLLNFNDEELILDMCAAPGGKAIFAALKNKNGVVIANDISKSRCNSLIENIERMGIDNIIVTSSDFQNETLANYYKNTFDKIILDAPCSGSGMFRKDAKMAEDWTLNKVKSCSEIQKKLILNAYLMLKPGGEMTYSTCSYSFEEDEEIVKYLLENSDAELIQIPQNDTFFFSPALKETIHLFPFKNKGEGQYVALIKKPGNHKKHIFSTKLSCTVDKTYKQLLSDRSNLTVNNTLYSLNKHFDASKLYILRYGVKCYSIENKIIKPEHHFAKSIRLENNLELTDLKEVIKYLNGQELIVDSNITGFTTVLYNKNPIGLVKISNNKAKNHYPKGLRR